MMFIGQNNHGKSNILSSLLFFFGEIRPDEKDFNDNSDELFIEITFNDLSETEQRTFQKYVAHDKTIKVRKSAYRNGSFEYKGYVQNPTEEWLQEEHASDYTNRDTVQNTPLYQHVPETGRLSKKHITDAQHQYIVEHKDDISFQYSLEGTNFLGAKNVAKGIFGEVYFIPALKNASDDLGLKESTTFGQLYSRVINKLSEDNEDWKAAKRNIKQLFSVLNKTDEYGDENGNRPNELTNFERRLANELRHWEAEIDVEVCPPDIEEVFKANTTVWIDDGTRTDIRRKGHGLQRALSFALIKTLSDVCKEEQEQAQDTEQQGHARSAAEGIYFLLEEPELFLHPQAQRALHDSLVDLSESGCQVLLSTHSSALVDLSRYKSICIVRKDGLEEGTKACQCEEDIYSDNDKKNCNLTYWVNPDRGELFFATKVILVEGPTDKTAIPFLGKKLNVYRHDYTLIDCGGKSCMPLYVSLLNKFSIPYVAVYDEDRHSVKIDEQLASADQQTKAIVSVMNNELGKSVVLVNDIEEELGLPENGGKNKAYVALEMINNPGYLIPNSLKRKIEDIYQ